MRARVLAASGRRGRGAGLGAPTRASPPTDDLTYLHEYEHVTLARVLLADHTASGSAAPLAAASQLLDRLLVGRRGG